MKLPDLTLLKNWGVGALILLVMAFILWLVNIGANGCEADHLEGQLEGVEIHEKTKQKNETLDERAVDAALARSGWLRSE